MADLGLSTTGTPAVKPWLNLTAGSIDVTTLIADAIDIKTIETNSLTLVQQVSVPNPAVGSQTLFVASGSGLLSAQDSLGNTVPYLPTNGTGVMTGPLDFKSDIKVTSDTVDADIFIGNGVTSLGTSGSVVIGDIAASGGNHQVVIGPDATASAGQYALAIGRNARASGFSDVVIGQSAISTASRSAVVIGDNANSQAMNAVAIGRNAFCTNAGTQQIAIGYLAQATQNNSISIGANSAATGNNCVTIGALSNNTIDGSILLGNTGITSVYPGVTTCTLGLPASPFRICYLRDAAPASACKYSQYGSVTVTNTAVDTSYATGTHVGSLILSANQTPGTVIRFKGNFAYSELLASSATFRIKVNGNPLVAQTVGPGAFVTQGMDIEGQIVVLGGGNAQCELRVLLETEPVGINNATSAWDETAINTLDFSVQYTVANAGNTLVCNTLFIETLFAQ